MPHFLRPQPSRGIGGKTDKREAFARRAAVPSGGNTANITEDICNNAVQQAFSEKESLQWSMTEKSKKFVKKRAEVYAKA